MTERASNLLGELADRLSADSRDSGQVVAESVRTLEPELLRMQKEGGSIDDLVRTSVGFLEILFRSLRADARVPWQHYYNLARVASRRYAERGIPLDSVLEGLAVFRRSVMARVTEEVAGRDYADEVLLLAQSRLGEVVETLRTGSRRRNLDYTEQRSSARQSELNGLYQIASALGRSLDVVEIAEVGLRETLTVLRLQAGAVWTREGARLTLAKTVGLQPGEEEEFESGRAGGRVRVVEIASGPAESRVDRIAGEWSAIRAELRTKGVLLGAMTVATRLPRTFEPSDLAFVAAVADQIAVALDRARQHTKEARTDYLTGLANRPEFERAIDRAVAASERHRPRVSTSAAVARIGGEWAPVGRGAPLAERGAGGSWGSAVVGREFFDRDTVTVARDLLGKLLVREMDGVRSWGRLIEVEAYLGPDDLAAHSRGGRRTPRTEVMFGDPGKAYVYFTYGMHWCLNFVTREEGVPQAVLVRALEPGPGVGRCSGPGLVTRALSIDRALNGVALQPPDLYLVDDGAPKRRIFVTPRIGVQGTGRWEKRLLRFCYDSSALSRPIPRALRPASRRRV